MRRAFLVGLLLVGVVVLGGADAAHACSCTIGTPAEQLAGSELVFTGTLTDVVGLGSSTNVAYERFAVDEVYKGDVGREVELRTSSQESACAPGFADDRRYLVYAYRFRGSLTTGSCSGNVADPAEAMLTRRFDGAEPPDPGIAIPPERTADLSGAIAYGEGYRGLRAAGVLVLGLTAVAIVAGTLAVGRRRTQQAPG